MNFNFLKKKTQLTNISDISGKITLQNVELISIHIPKTAGTSFYNILLDQYDNSVARIDMITEQGFKINQKKQFDLKKLQESRVIHGHFKLTELNEHFSFPEGTPIITWLRNPTDRIISNYFYLKKILENHVNQKEFPGLLPRLCRSLIEFTSNPNTQNKQALYLEDMPLSTFKFIGKTEFFIQDVQRLATMLDWDTKKLEIYHYNSSNKRMVKEKERQYIKKLNNKDWELYDKV